MFFLHKHTSARKHNSGLFSLSVHIISVSCSLSLSRYSYTVIRGTPERMLDHLVGSEVDTSQEGSFAHNFFLTHVAFMSMADLCSGLLTRYREKKEEEEDVRGGEVSRCVMWRLS